MFKYDEDGNGEIDFEEFRHMYVELAELQLSLMREKKQQVRSLYKELCMVNHHGRGGSPGLEPRGKHHGGAHSDHRGLNLEGLRTAFRDAKRQPSFDQLMALIDK